NNQFREYLTDCNLGFARERKQKVSFLAPEISREKYDSLHIFQIFRVDFPHQERDISRVLVDRECFPRAEKRFEHGLPAAEGKGTRRLFVQSDCQVQLIRLDLPDKNT